MTDKQNFEKNINAPSKPHACDLCGAYDCNGDDCKLYQAYMCKEQECEELKSVRDSWISKCEQETKVRELYQDGLNQLKAELEQEKNCHKTSDEISKVNSEYTAKLKQTLIEIKEIAKTMYKNYHQEPDLIKIHAFNKILQKISEAISE